MTRKPDTKTPPREATRKKVGDIRILVVDPHAIDRGGLVWLLEHEQGLEVVGEAASVNEALQQCRALSPDVVVITLNLPDQNDEAVVPLLLRKQPELKIAVDGTGGGP